MALPGEIYFDTAFVFQDKTVGEKLFLVLAPPDAKQSMQCLVAVITSQSRHFPDATSGCLPRHSAFYD